MASPKLRGERVADSSSPSTWSSAISRGNCWAKKSHCKRLCIWAFSHMLINHHGPPKLPWVRQAKVSETLDEEDDKWSSEGIGQEETLHHWPRVQPRRKALVGPTDRP